MMTPAAVLRCRGRPEGRGGTAAGAVDGRHGHAGRPAATGDPQAVAECRVDPDRHAGVGRGHPGRDERRLAADRRTVRRAQQRAADRARHSACRPSQVLST